MKIDRKAVVTRNNPVIRDKETPLSVGNGNFAYTADFTGFQNFPGAFPLTIQSNWGWHSFPGDLSASYESFRFTRHRVEGREVGYPVSPEGQEELFEKLRRNPHRVDLGRILVKRNVEAGEFRDIYRELDLWSGVLKSRCRLDGKEITVTTACHPEKDILSFTLKSDKPLKDSVVPEICFPYASTGLHPSGELDAPGNRTYLISSSPGSCELLRCMERFHYFVRIDSRGVVINTPKENRVSFVPEPDGQSIELLFQFSPAPGAFTPMTASQVEEAGGEWWASFWSSGGIVDFSGCRDPRGGELERRTILSQYLTAIHCSGDLPPQETGLSGNSWYGKFHLEMHFWHAAHFPLWKRPGFLEKSLWWYYSILEKARETARKQGYKGVRWPKMTGPGGEESPSVIGPYLIWQQPHPLYYAELLYRANPSSALLERYRELVYETAEFMASFVSLSGEYYNLAPPIISAQENHAPGDVFNPVFELEYWHFGLTIASEWYRRLKLPVPENWTGVLKKLAPLPVIDGLYPAHAECLDTYSRFNRDHPSFLGALGMLPGKRVRKEIMADSLKKVFQSWNFEETWGWDFPLMAMTAARTGLTDLAVDALLMDTPKNSCLPNGHNSQIPDKRLPLYLPGNGGLLLAVGLMAAGWEEAPPGKAPGFPADGMWDVQFEDIMKAL